MAASPQTPPFVTTGSLYVGDLHPEVTEANLFEVFNRAGPVASIRVCRDAVTRRSLGYAYVNYHSVQDAERALETFNQTQLKGRSIRVMWSQRDPSLRKSGKGNIFIKNLDKSIDHKALQDTFSQFGQIVSCKLETEENGDSKGYAYIQFATQEAADLAVQKVNGKMLADKKVFVGPFVPRKERLQQLGSQLFTNVFVKNLPETVDDDKLNQMFSAYGPITSAIIMKDEQDKPKGFGFVNFETAEDAALAVQELNGKEMEGKQLYVGRAQKKIERQSELKSKFEAQKIEQLSKWQGVNLYVKNLDDEVDDDKLRDLFTPFGSITSAKVMRDDKNHSKGFGFVCYTNPEEATKAVTEMNGKIVVNKPLYVGLAQTKDARRAQLETQFATRNKIVGPRFGPQQPLYNNAPPMFYGAGQPGFMYPQQMMPRGRFPPQGPGGMYPAGPGNYMMMPSSRGGMSKGGRGGPMAGGPSRRGGMKQPQAPAHQPYMQQPAPDMGASGLAPLSSSYLANLPEEERTRVLGERLYALIEKSQPSAAGKITGMILESAATEEILELIDNQTALQEKITEALQVLKEAQGPAENGTATAQKA